MTFDDLVSTMDDTVTAIMQRTDPVAGPLQLTIHPASGGADITVPCIVKNPMMEEDYVPGAQPGVSMLTLFIPPSAGVAGLRGDRATYGGTDYDILQVDADRCGGMHIRLRARTQPWNA